MAKTDIPIGETFLALDGQTYKAVLADGAATCRGCAFFRLTKLCLRYSCKSGFRNDRKDVHFVICEEDTKKGE